MDAKSTPVTRAALRLNRPSLEALRLLLTDPERLPEARAELDRVLSLSVKDAVETTTVEELAKELAAIQVGEEGKDRQIRELLHLGTKARGQVERAVAQLVAASKGGDPSAVAAHLSDATKALLEINRIHRHGTCGCSPAGGCEFAVAAKPMPRHVAITVKGPQRKLELVKPPADEGGAA